MSLLGKTESRIADLHKLLTSRGQTLSLAESCTGGLISSLFAKRAGVSSFFIGSAVTYTAEMKKNFLGVKDSTIQCLGEVSIPVAIEMARGARLRMKSTWSVSVTGIAGPTGGSKEKPVGTVCFSVCGPGFERAQIQHFTSESRPEIQLESAHFAIEFLWDSVNA